MAVRQPVRKTMYEIRCVVLNNNLKYVWEQRFFETAEERRRYLNDLRERGRLYALLGWSDPE